MFSRWQFTCKHKFNMDSNNNNNNLPQPAWWWGQRPQHRCWQCPRRTRGIPRGSRRSWGTAPIRSSSPRKAATFHITPVQLLNVAIYWDLCIDYPHHMVIIYLIIQTPKKCCTTVLIPCSGPPSSCPCWEARTRWDRGRPHPSPAWCGQAWWSRVFT